MANVSLVTGFLLLGFSDKPELQTFHGVLFLLMYLAALMSNLLITTLITIDLKLQTPMYFFLKNLSLLDVSFVSVPVPNFIIDSLLHDNSISILGCAFQILLMTSFSAGETFVLTAMSYDRYVAICHPLHYEAIMNGRACTLMAGASWALGGLFGAVYTAGTFSMPFCGSSVIPEFFCDIPSLLRILCSQTPIAVYVSTATGMCVGMSCCICIVISYVYIFCTVLRIPTSQGQSKAFSTCLPHLLVFSIFMLTACIVYLKPPSSTPSALYRLLSVIYTILPPVFNPVIYSFRNSDMKWALMRLLQRLCSLDSYFLSLVVNPDFCKNHGGEPGNVAQWQKRCLVHWRH
ncbi:olfactory receptor 14A2-like [Perognathus longimembris pacificus]|uniref:olfactory receptor 14A2-like n=1 Tax=Perognathus longimembris pacificus TaxID=214514 RepID=UPI002018F3B0|nr:olfactory receptor 14A2-like [Perognathus longimembris pacificus]